MEGREKNKMKSIMTTTYQDNKLNKVNELNESMTINNSQGPDSYGSKIKNLGGND